MSDLKSQMKRTNMERTAKPKKTEQEQAYEGNTELMVSTGSTLLDLAISGNRKRGGGLPSGIIVEIFGPEGAGKTVLLCEIAGAIQRKQGEVLFLDPEARLNKAFASMFDLNVETLTVEEPNTVTEMFQHVREWKPKGRGKVNGIITDSLAALSTDMEMDNDDGDKMGMRRAKEFSEGLRRVARVIKQNDYILACSNQIRVNAGASAYGEQFTVPGGKAFAFYASVRLRVHKPEKVKKKVRVAGKEVEKVIGTKVNIEVYKNSCDAPYRSATIYIIFDYGVDDVRANLQYLKDFTKATQYAIGDTALGVGMEEAIAKVEELKLEKKLKTKVIELWEEIENKFKITRTKKER